MSTRTLKSKQPLITRYIELKKKLWKEIKEKKKDYKHARGIKGDTITIPISDYEKDLRKQIRLLRESLELHKDTFSGEDDDLT